MDMPWKNTTITGERWRLVKALLRGDKSLLVRSFWDQPQNRVQVATVISGGGPPRFAEPVAPSQTDAVSRGAGVVAAFAAAGPSASAMGTEKSPCLVSAAGLAAAHSAHAGAVAATVGAGPASTPAAAQGLRVPASAPDGGAPPQSSLDGGFQGLVPGGQWRAMRTVDGARSVQSLWFGGARAAHATWPAGQGRLYKVVSGLRQAGCDADGQWQSVCFARPGGAFAAERLVGAAGHSGGVFPPGLSARQWRARTISWGVATGNRRTPRGDAPGTTASHHLLAVSLQPPPAARGAGASRASQMVSQE